jgi:hypothetical protein
MTAITVTAGQVGAIWPLNAEIRTRIAAEALTAGDSVYINSNGKVAKSNGGAAGTAKFRGVCLETVGAGQAVGCHIAGEIGGFDVSGLAYDAVVYLSDTAGKFDTAAGTVSVVAGRVAPMSDKDKTKVLRLDGYAG